MSLIITSSHEVGQTPQLQVDAPYAYRNNFGSGMKIPANSEIAVESVKVNRNPSLDYEPSQNTYFWFGQRLESNASYDESLSYIIPTENTIKANLSPQDFADQFEPVIKTAYSVHPEIDTVSGVTMDVLHTTSSVVNPFQGFRYNINQVGASATSKVPPAGVHPAGPAFVIYETGATAWDGTTLTAGGDDAYVQFQPEDAEGGPISLFDGELTYDNITGDNWRLGLSRAIINDAGNGFIGLENPQIPCGDVVNEGLGPDNDQFYDYVVEDDGVDVRIYHAVPTNDGSPEIEMREINYYQKNNTATAANNGSNSSFATGSPITTGGVTAVTFQVKNEGVFIKDQNGSLIVGPNNISSASFKDQVPKPVGQTCWKMYPTVGLEENGDTVNISSYRCRDSSTIKDNKVYNDWSVKCRIHQNMDDFTNTEDSGGSYRITDPWNNAWDWVTDVEFRKPNIRYLDEFGNENDTQDGYNFVRDYKGLNASTMQGYEQLFIVGQSDRYLRSRIQDWQPNSKNVLGFSPFAVVPLENSVASASGSASFSSTTRPSMSSEHSTFIRVPTLNHKTFNFGTGNPSKILFQVPRFDNSGAETGALYFQNSDKSFIDLNNPTEVMLTDLDVQFVRKDEKFARDLTGSSEVVFFIRPKAKM